MPSYGYREMAQRALRRSFGPALVRLTSSGAYDLRETLVVTGSPRSGTTWLAEVLTTLPRSAILFEPEHMVQVPDAQRAGLDWHEMKEPGVDWPEGERYFERVLRGQLITPWTVSHLPLRRAIAPRRWIVKFIDANLFLGWLATQFPIKPPILLLRHPCAVVSSQFRRGWRLDYAPKIAGFFTKYPHFKDFVASLRGPAEWGAARWCMLNYEPLSLPRPWPFVLMTYEQATREPEAEFGRLFRHWQLPMPDDLVARTRRPSGTADLGSAWREGAASTPSWKKNLKPDEIDGILGVVRAFGLDFYTDDALPDAGRLSSPSAIARRD